MNELMTKVFLEQPRLHRFWYIYSKCKHSLSVLGLAETIIKLQNRMAIFFIKNIMSFFYFLSFFFFSSLSSLKALTRSARPPMAAPARSVPPKTAAETCAKHHDKINILHISVYCFFCASCCNIYNL